jgi:hypothetical protein
MSVPLAMYKYNINRETITQNADMFFFPASGWLQSYSLKRTVVKHQMLLTYKTKFSTADISAQSNHSKRANKSP